LENQPRSVERTDINRETVFGDVPVNKFKPDWTPETMPDYLQLMKESFFEIVAVFVVAMGPWIICVGYRAGRRRSIGASSVRIFTSSLGRHGVVSLKTPGSVAHWKSVEP